MANLPEDTVAKLMAFQEQMIVTPPTMLTLDEPEHTKYRSLVSQLFTGSEIKKSQDARKEPLGPDDLDGLFKGKTRLLVAKGKKLVDTKFKGLEREELEKLVIGPSGNLRAPTFVVGKTLLVGFHPEAYEEVFG